jgi:hypothetical protein
MSLQHMEKSQRQKPQYSIEPMSLMVAASRACMSVTLDELKRSVTSNESGDLFDIGNSSYSPSVVSHVRCDGDDYGGIVE